MIFVDGREKRWKHTPVCDGGTTRFLRVLLNQTLCRICDTGRSRRFRRCAFSLPAPVLDARAIQPIACRQEDLLFNYEQLILDNYQIYKLRLKHRTGHRTAR
jgi:hypothetical protein